MTFQSLILILALSLTSTIALAKKTCHKVHTSGTATELVFKELVDRNLFEIQAESARTKSPAVIQLNNRQLIKDATEMPIPRGDFRKVNQKRASQAVKNVDANPVSGNDLRYQRDDVKLGYCFGRATCAHLQAIRDGYKQEQIKKVWVVGQMDSDSVSWGHHVALMLRDRKGQWWVIDDFTTTVVPLKDWYGEMLSMNAKKDLQIFITDPEKFGPLPGKYSRADLGLNLDPATDYYKGYFKDLMETVEQKK